MATPRGWSDVRRAVRTSPNLNNDLILKLLSKIELASFTQKGSRIPRWRLNPNDPEYCTETEALESGKKLLWLALLSRNAPQISNNLKPLLMCNQRPNCVLYIAHDSGCIDAEFQGMYQPTLCWICGDIIDIEDFRRDARVDAQGIQMGHRTPLSRGNRQHNAKNVFWVHRSCNTMQGERTLDEVYEGMVRILRFNGYTITPPRRY